MEEFDSHENLSEANRIDLDRREANLIQTEKRVSELERKVDVLHSADDVKRSRGGVSDDSPEERKNARNSPFGGEDVEDSLGFSNEVHFDGEDPDDDEKERVSRGKEREERDATYSRV